MARYPSSGAGGAGGNEGGGDGDRRRRGRDRGGDNRQQERGDDELKDKLVTINRVAKVVKGGRRFSFAALVVIGDQKGRVGWGAGKAREVPEAIRKATESAKRGMIRVPMREGRTLHHDVIGEFGAGRVLLRAAPAGTGKAREVPEAIRKATESAKRGMIRVPMREGRTLHHDVIGEFGAGRVLLRAAPAGTGIIAGGPMRAIFETLGMGDVVAKCLGSTNPHNMIKATFSALTRATSPRAVASRRGKKVTDLLGTTPRAPVVDLPPAVDAAAIPEAPAAEAQPNV